MTVQEDHIRHSKAEEAVVLASDLDRAKAEAENALHQAERVRN